MKKIDQLIKEQKKFVAQCDATRKFLELYKKMGSKKFSNFLSEDIKLHYRFDFKNDEHIWESIDEMMWDLFNGDKKFNILDINDEYFLEFANGKKKSIDYIMDAIERI